MPIELVGAAVRSTVLYCRGRPHRKGRRSAIEYTALESYNALPVQVRADSMRYRAYITSDKRQATLQGGVRMYISGKYQFGIEWFEDRYADGNKH